MAPCLRDERDIFLALLYTDMEVNCTVPVETILLHDAYYTREASAAGQY
jgi:hypothetical protein